MRIFLIRFWYFLLGEMYLIIHGKPCTGARYRVVGGYARYGRRGRRILDYYQTRWHKFPYPPEPDF